MPISVECPNCEARLTLRTSVPGGAQVKCPKCGKSFRIEDEEEEAPRPRRDPASIVPNKPSRPARRDAIDQRPPAKRPRQTVRDDEDEYDDYRPRRKVQEKAGSNSGLILGLSIGGGAVVLVGIILAVIFMSRSSTATADARVAAAEQQQILVNQQQAIQQALINANPAPAVNNPAPNPAPIVTPAPNPAPIVTPAPNPAPPVNPAPLVNPAPVQAGASSLTREVLDRVKAATLLLRVTMADGGGASGSGFFEANSGVILTNAHVVGMLEDDAKPRKIEAVLNSGLGATLEKVFEAEVITVDKLSDLAVLRPRTRPGQTLPTMPPGLVVHSSKDLFETQEVFIIGFPLGEELGKNITVSKSSVSSLRNDNNGKLNQVQVNGGMHPGNSGGPVVDTAGNLVGVAVAGIKGTSINFAIPAEQVHGILNGRVSTIVTEEPQARGSQTVVKFHLNTIDPLGRLKGMSMDYWFGDPNDKVPPSQTQPTSGPGRQTVTMTYNGSTQKADGEIILTTLPPSGKVLWMQPSVIDSQGQTRWLGGNQKTIEAPPNAVPVQVAFNPKPGISGLELKSKGLFKVKSNTGDHESVMINLVSQLNEKISKPPGAGVLAEIGIQKLEVGLSVNNKAPKLPPEMKAHMDNVKFMFLQIQTNLQGAVTASKVNLTRVPEVSKTQLQEFGDQMMQSLEVVTTPLPIGKIQPGQNWTAVRKMTIDVSLFKIPASVNMNYTYLGTREIDGQTVAVISLKGNVLSPIAQTGKKKTGSLNISGNVRGLVQVDVLTGRVLRGNANMDANFTYRDGKNSVASSGTMDIKLNRPAVH